MIASSFASPVRVPPGSYFKFALLAHGDLCQVMPEPVFFDDGIPRLAAAVSVAVYVIFDPEWTVAYVGSVLRLSQARGVESRVAEHLRERRKNARWRGMYVLPLKPETSPARVRQIEGRIGRALRPYMTRRLPC